MDLDSIHQRSKRGSPPATIGSPISMLRTFVVSIGSASIPIGGVAEVFWEPVPIGGRVPSPSSECVPVEPVEPTVAEPAAALDGSTLPPILVIDPMLPIEVGSSDPGSDCAMAGAAVPQTRVIATTGTRALRVAEGGKDFKFTGSPWLCRKGFRRPVNAVVLRPRRPQAR